MPFESRRPTDEECQYGRAKITQNRRDRERIADNGYEVEHIAKTIGITRHNAFRLIKRYGKDREALMRGREC